MIQPDFTPVVAIALALLIAASVLSSMFFFSKKWDPRGQHCFITGGSSGTGLALAVMLAKLGAHVSIVARNQKRLDDGLEALEKARQDPNQVLKAYSFAVDSEDGSVAALKAAAEPHGGRCPDALFLCAGASRPGYFVEQTAESLMNGMQISFGAQAFTALAGTKEMVRQGVKGKIVFVSSVLGMMSFVGYSTYSPGKFALRGLAEALRSELLVYGISVHIAFPATIFTPGLDEENKIKPKITLKVEESDGGSSPEEVAAGILNGVRNGSFHIVNGLLGQLFRASSACASPRPNPLLDLFYGFVGFIGLPIWRRSVDSLVLAHRSEHREYLRDTGFLS